MNFDLTHWLPNYTLQRLDTISMANNLEVRVPYLSHKIVEFTQQISLSKQFSPLQQKRFFRQAIYQNINNLPPKYIFKKKFPLHLNTRLNKVFSIDKILQNSNIKLFISDLNDIQKTNSNELFIQKRNDALIMFSLWLKNRL
jgi:hypothetical protein